MFVREVYAISELESGCARVLAPGGVDKAPTILREDAERLLRWYELESDSFQKAVPIKFPAPGVRASGQSSS